MTPTRTGFRLRAFTTLLVALGFVALLLSGGVLFLAPPGRIANWTNWSVLGLTKRAWSDLHVVFGALFLIVGVGHLIFNVRPFLQHLGARFRARSGFRPEGIAALLVAATLAVATRASWPPVSQLLAWSERLREGWDDDTRRAPIPHAELLALTELATRAGVATEEAVRRLAAAGIPAASPEARVQEIADAARTTPAHLYDVLVGRATGATANASGNHGTAPGNRGGGGPGWKTLAQFCADEHLDLAQVQARLAARGYRSAPDRTLREIAVDNGFDRPYALLEILRAP